MQNVNWFGNFKEVEEEPLRLVGNNFKGMWPGVEYLREAHITQFRGSYPSLIPIAIHSEQHSWRAHQNLGLEQAVRVFSSGDIAEVFGRLRVLTGWISTLDTS